MKKNITKFIILNVIILIIILISIEYYYAKEIWDVNNFKQYYNTVFKTISAEEYFYKLYKKEQLNNVLNNSFRNDENINSSLNPILLMGCSFTYGTGLKDNETFSYKLSQKTNRPIYNRAGHGWSIDDTLYQLEQNYIYNEMKEPKYIIYTFMNDQINRFDKFKIQPNIANFKPRYKLSNDRLKLVKPKITDKLYFIQDFQYNKPYRMSEEKKSQYYPQLCKKFFLQANEEIKKHWKNTKFVILTFPLPNNDDKFMYGNKIWQELRDEGFIVYSVEELTGKNIRDNKIYYVEDCGLHPSGAAWDEIIPHLIKKLSI